jgi:hypothetical protein
MNDAPPSFKSALFGWLVVAAIIVAEWLLS